MQIMLNGEPCEIGAASTLADLLRAKAWRSQQVAVEVNLQLVPRARHAEHVLREGDCVEVVTLVGGG